MEIAKLIVDLIGKLIWPIVLVVIVWKFRIEIAARIKDINEIELPGGVKAKLNQVIQVIDKRVEELDFAEAIESSSEKEIGHESIIDTQDNENYAKETTLLAFTANRTHEENFKYNIYYDPATRKHNLPFKYIGLYAWKSIIAVGEVKKIVYCNYEDGQLIGTNGYNIDELSKEEYSRIKEIIETTEYYDIEHGLKFFLVDNFYKTNFIKSSEYPIRAKKYIWLDQIEGFKAGISSAQLAKLLNEKEWE